MPRSPHAVHIHFLTTTQAVFFNLFLLFGHQGNLLSAIYPILAFARIAFEFNRLLATTAQSLQLIPASQKSAFLYDIYAIAHEQTGGLYCYVWAVNSQLLSVLLASTRQFYRQRQSHSHSYNLVASSLFGGYVCIYRSLDNVIAGVDL